MLRKIIISSTIIMTFILILVLTVSGCKARKESKSLSVIKANNYAICDEERDAKVVLYFTEDNCYNQKELVNSASFSSKTNKTKLSLKINDIKKGENAYSYNDDKYYAYEYIFTIPVISNELIIEDGYFCLEANGEEANFEIGSIHLLYFKDLGKPSAITVNYLLGKAKIEGYQTLDYFDIHLENKTYYNVKILDVWVDKDVNLVSNNSEDLIIGYMQNEYRFYFTYKKDKIIDTSFIVVDYLINNEKQRYVIDTYCFYNNGYSLPMDKNFIREYYYGNN